MPIKYLTNLLAFHDKNTQQNRNRRKWLNIIKVIYEKSISNIIVISENLKNSKIKKKIGKDAHSQHFYST